ncbi:uncharacterized protein LOC135681632 [Rhopilema esculentum]|uniref:uncharacterized protein LOC135681632 n=1 Tax=Rhopilema esculentum TaxID=499914 RepID=UPI0031CE4359|eukprot:gene13232-4053_t
MDCKGIAKPLSVYSMISSVSGTFLPLTGLGNIALILTIVIDPLKELRTRFNFIYLNALAADASFGFLIDGYRVWGNYLRSTGINLKKEYPYTVSLGKMCHVVYFGVQLISLLTVALLFADRIFHVVFDSRKPAYIVIFVLSVLIWGLGPGIANLYVSVGYSSFEFTLLNLNTFLSAAAFLAASFVYYQAKNDVKQTTDKVSYTPSHAENLVAGKEEIDNVTQMQPSSSGKSVEVTTDNVEVQEATSKSNKVSSTVAVKQQSANADATANAKSKLFAAEVLVVATASMLFFVLPAVVIVYIDHYDKYPSCIAKYWIGSWKLLSIATHKAFNPFICILFIGPFRRGIMHLLHIRRVNRVSPKGA